MSRDIVTAIRNGDTSLAAQLHTTKAMLAAAQEQARAVEDERAWLAAENETLKRIIVGLAEDSMGWADAFDADQSVIYGLRRTNDELRLQMRLVARDDAMPARPLTLTDRGDDGDGYCAYGGE